MRFLTTGGRVSVLLSVLALGAMLVGCGKSTVTPNTALGSSTPNATIRPPTAGMLSGAADKTRAAQTGKFEGVESTALAGALASSHPGCAIDNKSAFHGEFDLGKRQEHQVLSPGNFHQTGCSARHPNEVSFGVETVINGDTRYYRHFTATRAVDDEGWSQAAVERWHTKRLLSFFGGSRNDFTLTPDPMGMLEFVEAVDDDPTDVGRALVRGVDTRQVRASVSFVTLVTNDESIPGFTDDPGSACVRGVVDKFAFPVEVFVDDDGYIRRITATWDIGDFLAKAMSCANAPGQTTAQDASPTDSGQFTTTVDYFELGQPVSIATPNSSDVFQPVGQVIDE